jgi:pSer/pThr/pTyr-binding forkhead associated (FHA) protein
MLYFPTWFAFGANGGLACCLLILAACTLYAKVRKRGTPRQFRLMLLALILCGLLLLPALVWYSLRFDAQVSALEVGVILSWVALCGWFGPLGIASMYVLLTTRSVSQSTRQGYEPMRRPQGPPAPFVYNAETPWGWLVYRNGKFLGQELALKRAVIWIGREEDNEIWLDDDTVSRYHAELTWENGLVSVHDCGSLNGVLLNGQRVPNATLVKNGDTLEVGAHSFLLKYAQQPVLGAGLSDPLLPQLRRVAQSRSLSGINFPQLEPGPQELVTPSPMSIPADPQPRTGIGIPLGSALQAFPGQPGQVAVPGTSVNTNLPPGLLSSFPQSYFENSPPMPETNLPPAAGGQDISWSQTIDIKDRAPAPQSYHPGGLCVIRNGERAGRSFLLDRPVITLGRGSECDMVIFDASISRQHAQFLRQASGDYIQDLGSHNGSKVNGEQLTAPRLLRNGDIIMLGDVQLDYTLLFEAKTVPMPQVPYTTSSSAETPRPGQQFAPPMPMRLPSKIKQ